jgi:hypothetical protein
METVSGWLQRTIDTAEFYRITVVEFCESAEGCEILGKRGRKTSPAAAGRPKAESVADLTSIADRYLEDAGRLIGNRDNSAQKEPRRCEKRVPLILASLASARHR